MRPNSSRKRASAEPGGADSEAGRPGPAGAFRSPARFAVLCALLCLFCAAAAQAACPSGPASLFVPGNAKSQVGLIFAPLSDAWQRAYGQSLLQTAAPGRGGSYAVARCLEEKNDQCSFCALTLPSFFLLAEDRNATYRRGDIIPAPAFASAPNALWADADGPFRTLDELLLFARAQNERPDGVFALAGTGRFTDQHLASRQLERTAGVRALYLPELGSAEAAAAVREGRAAACWAYALPEASLPGMRPLAVAGESRSPVLPQTPTFRELGLEIVNHTLFTVGFSAKLPEKDAEDLRQRLARLVSDPGLARDAAGLGLGRPSPAAAALEDSAKELLDDYDLIPARDRRPGR